jgi:hypothetical protein
MYMGVNIPTAQFDRLNLTRLNCWMLVVPNLAYLQPTPNLAIALT